MKRLRISVEGKTYEVEVELLDEDMDSPAPRASGAVRKSARVAAPAPRAAAAPVAPVAAGGEAGSVASPLAAVVVSVDVAIGDAVEAGQTVVTLEAMKMNTVVTASSAGTVKSISVSAGDAVEEGQALILIA